MVKFKPDGRILFWLLFGILFFVYAYQKVIDFPSYSVHSWRQADCLSLSQNFMDNNNPLTPEIHNYISDKQTSGKSAGEFTGLYYFIGKLWSFFGKHLFLYRLTNLMLMVFACYSLFKALLSRWRSSFWALFVSLFVLTSPLIVYYSPNFLTDITALSFTIWGWAYFIRYIENKEQKQLTISLALFGLGALFKVTAGISPLALVGIFGLELMGVFSKSTPLFPDRLKTFLRFSGMLLVVIAWYVYAEYYNGIHGGKYTFNDLWPLWELSNKDYNHAIEFFHYFTFSQFFQKGIFWFLVLLTVLALYLSLRNNIKLFTFLIFYLLGCTCYIIFWFGALENHDYYFVNLFTLPILILGINVHYLVQSNRQKIKVAAISAAVLIFTVGVFYSATSIRLRYSDRLTRGKFLTQLFYDKSVIEYCVYMAGVDNTIDLLTMEKYNRSIGMKKTDLVICYPDPSFNISLFRLNQKGWTTFNNPNYTSPIIQKHIRKGAKYMIIKRSQIPTIQGLLPFMKDSVGYYKGFTVFKLHKK